MSEAGKCAALFRVLVSSTSHALACACAIALFAPPGNAEAKSFRLLYEFANQSNGSFPYAGLIADAAGNLYGATSGGGANGLGAIFKLAPDGSETVLYSFKGGSDGAVPYASLIADTAGDLYGTTTAGGAADQGTVFKLAPDGNESVLYAFTNANGDGGAPYGALIEDGAGNLYGTTVYGGGTGCDGLGCGTVFKIAPGGSETILHVFAGYPSDGFWPHAGLVADVSGNLYGTTMYGGDGARCKGYGCGTIFKLAPDGSESVLHSFKGGSDGETPFAGLIIDKTGILFGTTSVGGDTGCSDGGSIGCGTVFKLAPDGHETLLHVFAGESDGIFPAATVSADSSGNLFGTTVYGGSSGCKGHIGCGTVFEVAADGSETVLHTFDQKSRGLFPYGGVLVGKRGHLYGTTLRGGVNCVPNFHIDCGTVFVLRK